MGLFACQSAIGNACGALFRGLAAEGAAIGTGIGLKKVHPNSTNTLENMAYENLAIPLAEAAAVVVCLAICNANTTLKRFTASFLVAAGAAAAATALVTVAAPLLPAAVVAATPGITATAATVGGYMAWGLFGTKCCGKAKPRADGYQPAPTGDVETADAAPAPRVPAKRPAPAPR